MAGEVLHRGVEVVSWEYICEGDGCAAWHRCGGVAAGCVRGGGCGADSGDGHRDGGYDRGGCRGNCGAGSGLGGSGGGGGAADRTRRQRPYIGAARAGEEGKRGEAAVDSHVPDHDVRQARVEALPNGGGGIDVIGVVEAPVATREDLLRE